MGKLTKDDLVKRITAEAGGLTQGDVARVLEATHAVAAAALAEGSDVILPGLGILKRKDRPARTGRNPRTGEAVEIAAKTAVAFKPAKPLIDALNA